MVCSALFLQRALCKHNALYEAVICDLPAVLFNIVNRYFSIYNKIRHILLNQFKLINFDINTVQHPWLHEEIKLCSTANQ